MKKFRMCWELEVITNEKSKLQILCLRVFEVSFESDGKLLIETYRLGLSHYKIACAFRKVNQCKFVIIGTQSSNFVKINSLSVIKRSIFAS